MVDSTSTTRCPAEWNDLASCSAFVILPPLISQYLNLTKNSSLALLITFVDFFAIGRIIGNQTGATVPIIVIIILGYLLVSLTFALVLNIVNDRFALVER